MENDDVRANVGILGLKKNGRERANSLMLLSFQWKDLEDHYETMQQTIGRRAEELRIREEAVKNGLCDVEERMRFIEAKRSDFDLLWEAMDAKFRGLEQFGSKCSLAIEGGRREVEERVEEAESMVARVDEVLVKDKAFEYAINTTSVSWIASRKFIEEEW